MDLMPDDSTSALPPTMTAWRQHRYGGTESVIAETVALPVPGPGEVLLQVRATAINAGDIHLMRGEPLLVRLIFGLRRPKHAVRGMDVAGTVIGLGPDVAGFAAGDEVVGELPGLVAAGRLRPVIEATYPLTEAPAALAHVDAGHTVGKVVVVAE